MTRKSLYIIDGHAQIFRAYHAIRSLSSPVTGEPTNATFGFVGMLIKLYSRFQPDYLVMTLDAAGEKGTFRSRIDPQYKANREAPPVDLEPQVDRIAEICRLFGIPVLAEPEVEADDVIATLCNRLADRDDLEIYIVSRDKDLQQLLAKHVHMIDVHKDQLIDCNTLLTEKGITPEQVVDMLALMGDTADNIPGAVGVGPKTAAKLIAQFGSLEQLLSRLDQLKGKQKQRITEAGERLMMNLELIRLKTDVPFRFDLEQAKVQPIDFSAVRPIFDQLNFKRHLDDLQQLGQPDRPAAPAEKSRSHDDSPGLFDSLDHDSNTPTETVVSHTHHIDPQQVQLITDYHQLQQVIQTISQTCHSATPLAVDTETDSLRPRQANLCGISLAVSADRAWYIPTRSSEPDRHLNTQQVIEALRAVLEDPAIPKVGQNIKYDLIVLRNAGVRLQGLMFDTMIGSWLLDPSRSGHGMDALALAWLNWRTIHLDELIGKGKKQITFEQVPLEQAAIYAGEDALVTWALAEKIQQAIQNRQLEPLFNNLELPLIEVLAEMEFNGIQVNADLLDLQQQQLQRQINDLRSQIIDAAGEDFNIDSTKQLAEILFNKLQCKVVKKRKTGPSTDAEVLNKIVDQQTGPGAKVAQLVLQYRELTKLVGTYLQSLKQAIHPQTGRIHASFNQTGTATGRLSSSDPNLQNIPIRRETGRLIRQAFIAPPDHLLIGADYSQIELRILAHLAKDEALIRAFQQEMDIHTAVAAQVFDVQPDQVNAEQRSAAKMVNFGIIYGITPYGLARRLTADAQAAGDVEQAKQIIDDYKQRYPGIDTFMQQCINQAQSTGSVTTIAGRRRPIPQLQSRNGNERALGERMAINTVVQGSAADLIKQAMIDLYRQIHDDDLPMRMLLQIHDELVFEVPEKNAQAMAEHIRNAMSSAMTLSVPLKVDLATGRNWMQSK